MKHLLFDFNKVLLFPKHSIPVDLLMMLQHKLDPLKVDTYQNNIDFAYYFEWNTELLDKLSAIKQKQSDVSLHIYTNSTFSIKIADSQEKIVPLFSSQYLAKEIDQPKDTASSYEWLANELASKPSQLFFTDDTATNVIAAAQAGLWTHHFTENKLLLNEIELFLNKEK